ncbi:MAG: glycogen/starch synthase [Bacilli bacterium]|nr:glycogen/starch synthase [Bacilli bacterium]MBN2696353.1 glycogen/starch synthase [Bacilli bacterium]
MANLFLVCDASNIGSFNRLTRHRVPGALPFGAKYRLIDFTLSNCKNSNITNVAIFPYGNYRSLSDHIGSGDRWDLNRRKDGIFILPPKNLNLSIEDSLSFQRMYEHLEYFNRSTQEYVIVSPANLVWNVDYQVLLHDHLVHSADITEVVSAEHKRMRTYVLSKSRLLEYITNYDTIPYRNLTEVFDYAQNLKKHPYHFEQACFFPNSAFELYQANMQLLNQEIRAQLFRKDRPIFSKETMSAPSRYGDDAKIKNSIVASGAVVDGTVINSIIGRKTFIHKDAVVKNSIVMNQCHVEPDSIVEYALLDKETRILAKAKVIGNLDQLFVSEKKQIVISGEDLKVLQITAECNPFVKTGGLADIVGSLAENYSELGVSSSVMMPLYPRIKDKYKLFIEIRADQIIAYGDDKYKTTLYSYNNQNVNYYFIESYDFFDRDDIYGYEDDGDRFAFFSKAALAFLDVFDDLPDIIHIHDWHMGLVPLIIKENEHLKSIRTLMTIHNIEYQGVHEGTIYDRLGIHHNGNHHRINFMEVGLNNATKISTVSETYKEELKYEYYSKNLVEVINRRDRDFYGIINGLSDDIGPNRDLTIKEKYNLMNVFGAKPKNKSDLQKRMSLSEGNDYFVIGMVTRIVEQKGFDILLPALEQVLANEKIQFVILGAGDERYVRWLESIKQRHPTQVALNIGYDATEPSYIYAGADAFLMPSRYEPCGTSQMIALKYGTIPIVRQTGGLNDTVDAFDGITKRGNGFKFFNYDYRDLVFQIENAFKIFTDAKEDWRQMIINAMNSRFWQKDSANAYIDLYRSMLT